MKTKKKPGSTPSKSRPQRRLSQVSLELLFKTKKGSAQEIAAAILNLVNALLPKEPELERLLEPAKESIFTLKPLSSGHLTRVCLLAILLDEISYAPASEIRDDQISKVQAACKILKAHYEDVKVVSGKSPILIKILFCPKP